MADLKSKKRRRWLIVASVLLLVSMTAWWYWPRGDARFVGKWEWLQEDFKHPAMLITLHRSGTAEIVDLSAPPPRSTTRTSWRVRYNCLCFGFDRRSEWYDEMVKTANTVIRTFGINFDPRGHGHLILDAVNPDEIRLSSWMILNGDRNIILRRIPE